jgi:hypothetical protein
MGPTREYDLIVETSGRFYRFSSIFFFAIFLFLLIGLLLSGGGDAWSTFDVFFFWEWLGFTVVGFCLALRPQLPKSEQQALAVVGVYAIIALLNLVTLVGFM